MFAVHEQMLSMTKQVRAKRRVKVALRHTYVVLHMYGTCMTFARYMELCIQ